jgi:hypothetical protein
MLLDIEIRHVKYNPDNRHYRHPSYSAFFLKTRAVGFVVAKSYEYEELYSSHTAGNVMAYFALNPALD